MITTGFLSRHHQCINNYFYPSVDLIRRWQQLVFLIQIYVFGCFIVVLGFFQFNTYMYGPRQSIFMPLDTFKRVQLKISSLFLNQNIGCWYSKNCLNDTVLWAPQPMLLSLPKHMLWILSVPSRWDGSFEHPKTNVKNLIFCLLTTRIFTERRLFITRYSLFITRYSLFITRYSLFITRYSPFITRYSLFITRYSPFITRYSLFITQYSPFITRYSLFITRYSLLTLLGIDAILMAPKDMIRETL